jgi:hypothetical protein
MSQNGAQIIEIRQKLTEHEQILVSYFENDADRAALVRFQFWIENKNRETVLFKWCVTVLWSQPEPIVKQQLDPKERAWEGAELVLSSWSINLLHLP